MNSAVAEQPISERTVRNAAAAMAAWARSMRHDHALDAVFLDRIGMTDDELRALPMPENMAVNLRYKRWQNQCGITEEQTPQERMALAVANREPVVE